jgi:hypothetical protein
MGILRLSVISDGLFPIPISLEIHSLPTAYGIQYTFLHDCPGYDSKTERTRPSSTQQRPKHKLENASASERSSLRLNLTNKFRDVLHPTWHLPFLLPSLLHDKP